PHRGTRGKPGAGVAAEADAAEPARRVQASGILAVHGHLPRDGTAQRPVGIGASPLEEVAMNVDLGQVYRGRRVLVTGHTGFKGAWLCLWLRQLGAEVTGYALPAATEPSLYSLTRLDGCIRSILGDVRD